MSFEDIEGEVEKVIDKLHQQFKVLEEVNAQQETSKKRLAFVRVAGTFKERNDAYYIGITISNELEEVEKMLGCTSSYTKKSHCVAYLVVVIILPKFLQCSFKENLFKLNITVKLDQTRLCRTVTVDNINSLVIPCMKLPVNSELEISFFGKIRGKNVIYRIPKILLSLSYFLRPCQNVKRKNMAKSFKEKLFCIVKQYDSDIANPKANCSKCSIIVHNDFKFCDIVNKASPSHLNKSLFENQNLTEWQIINDACQPSPLKMVKKNPFIQIESDPANLREMKKFLVNENLSYKELDILAIKDFAKKYEEFSSKNVMELYNFLREICSFHKED